MHHFTSMMFPLLVITGLQESVDSYRSEMTVSNGAGWGTWGVKEMCPTGTYAAGFSLKVEASVGSGDDTALNGIRLLCVDLSRPLDHNRNYPSVRSEVGSWGQWTEIKWCPSGFLTRFQLRVEKPQRAGDDTAANNINFKCGQVSLSGDGTDWGDWGDWSQTCEGKGICGLQTRVEAPQGAGDDTALNDVRMFCCD